MLPLPKPEVWWVLPALDCMEVCWFCVDCCHSLPTVPGIPHEAALSDRFFGSN